MCEIQQRLDLLGFSPGGVDGQPGEKTKQALNAFLEIIKPKKKRISFYEILDYLRTYNIKNKTTQNKSNHKRPRHGTVFATSDLNGIAPLRLKTRAGNYDFFVKLSDFHTNRSVKSFYVRGGAVINTKLPLGKYNLKYVSGKTWYGNACLFGKDTLYSKADKVFTFARKGNTITGYSVELILQVDGNLSTKKIKPDDW